MKQKTVALCIAGKNNIKHKMNIDTLYIYIIYGKNSKQMVKICIVHCITKQKLNVDVK